VHSFKRREEGRESEEEKRDKIEQEREGRESEGRR
jgi:hypothetical protein